MITRSRAIAKTEALAAAVRELAEDIEAQGISADAAVKALRGAAVRLDQAAYELEPDDFALT